MQRTDFIKLGVTSCVSALAVGGLGSRLLGQSDELDRWIARFRGSLTTRPEGQSCTIRAELSKMGAALEDLNRIVDGKLHCAGNTVRAQYKGRALDVLLQAA